MKIISLLLFLYLVLFPFGQLTRLPLEFSGLPEVHLYLTDIFVFFLLCSWGIWRFLVVRKKYSLPSLAIPIFSFSLICLLSLGLATPLFSNREVMVAGLYLLRWVIYAGLYFVMVDISPRFKWLNRRHMACFLVVIGVMLAIFGLVQYLLWPDLKPLEALEWDPHNQRVVSTFLDPGFTGLILVLTLILIIVLSWQKKIKKPWAMAGLITYIALALTYSRSSYLAFFVGMGVITLVKKAPKFFLAVLLLGLGTFFVLPRPAGEGGKLERTYSIEARFKNWQQTIAIARDHPFLGVGFNTYRYVQEEYGFLDEEKWQVSHSGAGADSSLLFVLATTGLLGLIAYLWIWVKAISSTRRSLIIVVSLAAVFTHALFLNSLFYSWVMAWLWLLLATECS